MSRAILFISFILFGCSKNLHNKSIPKDVGSKSEWMEYLLKLINTENLKEGQVTYINPNLKFRDIHNFEFIKFKDEILDHLKKSNKNWSQSSLKLQIPKSLGDKFVYTTSNEAELLDKHRCIFYFSPMIGLDDDSIIPTNMQRGDFTQVIQRVLVQGSPDYIEILLSYYFLEIDEKGMIINYIENTRPEIIKQY